MNPLQAAWTILGTVSAFLAFGAIQSPAEPSQSLLDNPPIYEVYEYGEAPIQALAQPATTTTSTTTTVWVAPRPKTDCQEALQLALDVGWPAEQMARLAVVMWRESRCSAGPVLNPDDPYGGSRGLLQINGFWCKPNSNWPKGWLQTKGILSVCEDLYDPETNLKAGLAIWRNSGWQPWGFNG